MSIANLVHGADRKGYWNVITISDWNTFQLHSIEVKHCYWLLSGEVNNSRLQFVNRLEIYCIVSVGGDSLHDETPVILSQTTD